MIPSRRAMLILACLVPIGVVTSETSIWLPIIALGLVVLAWDAGLVRRQTEPTASRRMATNLAVNRRANVVVLMENTTTAAMTLDIYDEVPAHCEASGLPQRLMLGPGSRAEVRYELTPRHRGNARFGAVVGVLRSPWGLWQRRLRLAEADTIRVYPDFAAITGYLRALGDQQAVRLGIRLAPRRGEGLEFHQLREYRDGDSVRQVDWKATARRQSLISRDYQEERDQQVLFLIDSGRRMRTSDEELSHFDYALNAMLLLAYIALRQGDSVALLTFGSEQRWIPPQRGVSAVNRLLNQVYDLHSGTEAADFVGAAEAVMSRQRKRALVVLMTNLRDEDDDLLPALRLLRDRHVVVLANLRERVLDVTAEREPDDFPEALRLASVHTYLAARRRHHARCAPLVEALLDRTPQQLPVSVVNAYWEVKRSGRL